MTKEWKAFEELVARIEKSLAPKGAIVTSPDRIKDLVTGKMREVDASIRFQVGSVPILITVECRKRKGVQDDTWIEQLATKRQKIGAAKTIAVSATGFSDSARKTAALNGIELRSLTDRIGEEIVQQYLSGLRISMTVTDYRVVSIAFEGESGRIPVAELPDDLKALFTNGTLDSPIAEQVGTGKLLTLNGILRRADDSDVPASGEFVRKSIAVAFEPRTVRLLTGGRTQFISKVEVLADFMKREILAPATALYEYSSDEATLRRTVEAIAPVDDEGGFKLQLDIESESLNRPQ